MSKNSSASPEAIYTICPVLVASHIAVDKGWLEDELHQVKASLKYLRSLAPAEWLAHFTHTRTDFFRDGGNIPAIWAKAEGRKTKLIGLTFSTDGGQILTRADANIHQVSDLRGKKIGLFQRANTDRVDFWRATAHRAILVALGLARLSSDDVEIVDLSYTGPDYASTKATDRPEGFWQQNDERTNGGKQTPYLTEIEALLGGKVDAIYSNRGRSQRFQQEGNVKVIEDLGRYPDWTVQIANSPYTLTVSEELADEHPEVVVAYLKAVIRAGRWINANPQEAAAIFGRVISYWEGNHLARELVKYDFVPSLSKANLAALDVEKRWLLEYDYIPRDFDSREWADSSFLERALAESGAEYADGKRDGKISAASQVAVPA